MKIYTPHLYIFRFTIFLSSLLGSLLPCSTASGQPATAPPGLLADYYHGYFDDQLTFFTTENPVITNRIVGNLNFVEAETDNFNAGPAATYYTAGRPDEFSARYRGKLFITTPGSYTFYLGSDDAASLWLDAGKQPVLSNVGDKVSYRQISTSRMLTAGWHDILVYYGEHGGSQGLVLEYAGPDMIQQVVPNGVLYAATDAAVAPVLVRFDLAAHKQQVTVLWATETERDCKHFVVERSTDGVNFQEIARQAGAGTSTQAHSYQAIDRQPSLGLNYYRLRQELGDNTKVYSPIRTANVEKTPPPTMSVYPNPNAGKFYVQLQQEIAEDVTLELLDMSGRRQYQQTLLVNNGDAYRLAPKLATGLYILRLTTSTGTLTQKLVIAK